jgi:hypothetical protein
MQSANNKYTFFFQADASALGGVLETPIGKVIPTQAAVSLPGAGGFTSDRAEALNLDELVSCGASHARASGRAAAGHTFSTLVTSVVEDVNILEVVTADRIVSQLAVEYRTDGKPRRISMAGSSFEGLRVGGRPFTPAWNCRFVPAGDSRTRLPVLTWDNFLAVGMEQADRILENSGTPEQQRDDHWLWNRFQWMKTPKERPTKEADPQAHAVLCSLVDGSGADEFGEATGHIIEIPEFGRIFLGEVLLTPTAIQLTMIRAELGCNVHGHVTVGTAGSGGHTVPPIRTN